MATHAVKVVSLLVLGLALSLTLSTPRVHAQDITGLVNFDFPNAIETECNGINNNGVIVGHYVDSSAVDHGFIRRNNTPQTVDVPKATGTLLYGANSDTAVGWYNDQDGITHGFSVNTNHTIKTIDPPGTTLTNAWDINDAGVIVGDYTDSSGVYHGFTLNGKTYTTYDAPNGAILTEILGINNLGDMSGIFDDSSGEEHGFVLSKGVFTQIDYPGSGIVVTATDRVNDLGEIVGLYGTSTSGPFSGYHAKNKTFTTIMYPGSYETRTRGVDNQGVVVGRYTDQEGNVHGYYGVPSN